MKQGIKQLGYEERAHACTWMLKRERAHTRMQAAGREGGEAKDVKEGGGRGEP
jgi:hypothetical protein